MEGYPDVRGRLVLVLEIASLLGEQVRLMSRNDLVAKLLSFDQCRVTPPVGRIAEVDLYGLWEGDIILDVPNRGA